MSAADVEKGAERKRRFASERCREVIGSIAPFSELAPEALDDLAFGAQLRTVANQGTIYEASDPSDALYIVENGAVILGCAADDPEGKKVAAHWIGRGEMFGEMEFVEAADGTPPPPRQMRAFAAADSVIVVLDGRSVRRMFDTFPRITLKIARSAATRHRRLVEVLERQSFIGLVEIRLGQILLERARVLGVREGAAIRMPTKVTHQQLGDLLTADRRSVLETMRLWEDAGLVHVDHQGVITILDLRGLEAISRMRSGQRKTWEAESWLALIDADLARGYNARAFDEACDALRRPSLARHPQLRHRAVLAAARSFATSQALAMLSSFGFDHTSDDDDIAALEPRLLKDLSRSVIDEEARRDYARRSAELYLAIFSRSRNYYPGINAAAMFVVAGESQKAAKVAARVLNAVEADDPAYYAHATRAEAALILGEFTRAERHLGRALAAEDANPGAIAATRRQLRMLGGQLGIAEVDRLLEQARQRRVIFFTGHMMPARTVEESAQGRFAGRLADAVGEALASAEAGWAYGSLACGSDIIIAEAILEAGHELNIVLPVRSGDFIAGSVASGGKSWVARYNRCLEQAHRVIELGRARFGIDDQTYYLGHRFTMGLALRRAAELDTEAALLAVWDGRKPTGIAGTARAVGEWSATGRQLIHIPCPWPRPAATEQDTGGDGETFGFVPMLFCQAAAGQSAPVLPAAARTDALVAESSLGDGQTTWIFQDLASAATAAGLLTEEGRRSGFELRAICDVGPRGDCAETAAWRSAAAIARPICPANVPFATEMFMAEAALRDIPLAGEYAGRVQTQDDSGPLPIYTLRP